MTSGRSIPAPVLLGYLRKHCAGEARARTQGRIAADLGRLGLDADTRTVRDALAALANAGYPVGTSTRGAFLCVERRDFRRAYRNLYGRLIEQSRRCRRFKATAREAMNGQRVMAFARADAALADLEARAGTLFAGRLGEAAAARCAGDARP